MKLIELFLDDEDNNLDGVSAIALVDKPAIELPFQYFSAQEFVEPNLGEGQDEFISRCIAYVINEGKPEDQAAAICYSLWQNRFAEANPNVSSLPPYVDQVPKKEKGLVSEPVLESTLLEAPLVSFDHNGVLTTERGQELAKQYMDNGYKVIIICDDHSDDKRPVIDLARQLEIEDAYFTNGSAKWPVVKELGVAIHVDDSADEINAILENTEASASLFIEDMEESRQAHELMIEVLASVLGEECKAEFDFNHKKFAEQTVTAPEVNEILQRGQLEAMDQTLNNGDVRKLRYRYKGPKDSKNRALCAKLLTLNRLYTRLDLNAMNRIIPSDAVPRPRGGVIDLYEWKGGANCRHAWEMVIFTESPRGAIRIESTNIVSPVNPKASQGKRFAAFALDEEQMIVIGPAMVPNMRIPRLNEETGERYDVFFTEETIAKLAQKFARELRLPETNVDHRADKPADAYVYESWLVSDPEKDKSALYGYKLPKGTWMVAMKVESEKTWALIKQGYLRGFSIEGFFGEKLVSE